MSDAQTQQLAEDFEGGFFRKEKSNWLRFQLFDGSICLRYDEPGEGREGPITTQNPETKQDKVTYVERFDSLVVRIINVEKYKKEFAKNRKVINYNFTVMTGKGKRATLQLVYMDSFLKKFLKVAPNIDFNKFVRLAAFKKDGKQLISIKQGDGPDYKEWPSVPFFWQHPELPDGRPDYTKDAKGRDGTILPPPIHDEDEGTWDFRAQNKFLVKHFVENTLPKIKEIATALGVEGFKPPSDEELEYSGPAQQEIPIVTEKPSVLTAMTVADAMTPSQAIELRKLCKRLGKDPDEVAKAALKEAVPFDSLSIAGAAYLKYRIEKKIEKDPSAYPDPEPQPLVSKKKSDEIDDEWEAATAPTKAVKDDDDDDDDDSWGEAKAPVKSAFHADEDEEDTDDITF